MINKTQAEFDKEVIAFYKSNYPNGEEPVLDGILNEDVYKNQDSKILWVLKEPYGDAEGNDVRFGLMNNPGYLTIPTFREIIRASHCLLNNIREEEMSDLNLDKKRDVLKKIAFMNIKKDLGETISKDPIIANAYRINKVILKEQINFIKPHIIICGNTLHHLKDDKVFGLSCDLAETDELKENDFGVWYMERENKLFIEAFHPSGRGWFKNSIEPLQKTINHWKAKKC
jgi:hypothetical protein